MTESEERTFNVYVGGKFLLAIRVDRISSDWFGNPTNYRVQFYNG